MKLAIVVGHNSEKQGAVRGDTGETEFRFNSRIADMMHELHRANPVPGLEIRTFFRRPGLGYSREIGEVYDAVDAWGADASIELHFNGASDPRATGTEVLSSGTAASLRLAGALQKEITQTLGLRDRGIRTRSRQDRGGQSLFSGRAPAVLVEPFFGSSALGQRATDERHEQRALASAYLVGAVEAMRTFPRSDLGDSRTLSAAKKQEASDIVKGTAAAGSGVSGILSAVTDAKTQIDAIDAVGAAGGLSEWLPYVSGGLALIAVAATVYGYAQTRKIKAARKDDHRAHMEWFG